MIARKKKFVAMAYGDKGPQIEEAQKLLKAAGSTIKVNGEFTIGMKSAVKCFQKKNGLVVNGIIDSKTWEKLLDFAKPAPKKGRKAK